VISSLPLRWLFLAAGVAFVSIVKTPSTQAATIAATPRRLPAGFEENRGQAPEEVRFLGSVGGHRVFFTSEGVQFVLVKLPPRPAAGEGDATELRERKPDVVARVGMIFDGASPETLVVGGDLLPGKVHHLVGPPSAWRRDIPLYARVRYEGVYPGIDAVFYDAGGWLKYDFLVAPGAQPEKIQLQVNGAESLRLTEEGDLLIHTAAGEIRQRRPFVYQERSGEREEVGGSFAIAGNHVAFTVGPYDRSRVLVIDPQIGYSTYIGGNRDDQGFFGGLAVDGEGNAYVSGETNSATGLLSGRTTRDAFVAKIDPKGERLLFLVYLGGSGDDQAFDVFVDGAGNAYLTGTTTSPNFTGADPSGYVSIPPYSIFDTFLVKLTSTGALVYSRYFGLGSGFAIAADRDGNAYLSSGGSVDKFDPSGGHLATTSFVNEGHTTTRDLRLDAAGNIYATGHHAPTPAALDDVFVARVSADLGSTAFVLLPSGGGQDRAWGLATDGAGNVYVAGETNPDPHLPSQKMDAFVAKLTPDLSLLYLTHLGGSDWDQGRGVAADGSGSLYVTGPTASLDFPTKDPFTTPSRLGSFVMKLKADTSEVVWSTLIGGDRGAEAATIAVDGLENVYVQGRTSSTTGLIGPGGLQPTYGGGSSDIFLIQIKQEGRAKIDVLPSTTRWKPQRAIDPADPLAPIKVNFKGPNDLDPITVRLEVTPPAGFFGTYTPTKTAVTKVAGKDDEYTFDWTGPWTYEPSPGTTLPMPRGNYSLVVFGKRQNTDTEIKNETLFNKVSLVDVTKLELNGQSLEGDGSGSWRIFAEANDAPTVSQPEPEVLDRVTVAVTTEPPVDDPGVTDPAQKRKVTVYFRALDVADASPDGTPTQCSQTAGFDNCGDAKAGQFTTPDGSNGVDANVGLLKTVDEGSGATAATFRASMRQGDNYRIAVSLSKAWIDGLKADFPSPTGVVRDGSGAIVGDPVQLSTLITVWRTLHLEVEGLTSANPQVAQDALDIGPGRSFTSLTATTLEDTRAGGVSVPGGGSSIWAFIRPFDHPDANDWAGADLSADFHAADVYNVTASTPTSLTAALKLGAPDLLNGLSVKDILNRGYRLSDDSMPSLANDLDTTLAEALLASAYINLKPIPRPLGSSSIAFDFDRNSPTFNRNVEKEESYRQALSPVPSTNRYWTTALINGFDSGLWTSLDPSDKPVPGRTTRTLSVVTGNTTTGNFVFQAGGQFYRKIRSWVFSETIRDLRAKPPQWLLPVLVPPAQITSSFSISRRVTAHEILHQLGLSHDGAIMCATVNMANNPLGDTITLDQLKLLRFADQPTLLERDVCR
jgi:hypothetical protein